MATRSDRSHTSALVLALALLLAAPPGVLHAQDTAKAPASTAPAGTRVTRPTLSAPATIARPPASTTAQPAQQPAIVPDVAGRTVDQARRLLAAAGLEVGSVGQGTGSGTPGTIVQQQPRAGSAVAPKSSVQLWLAPEATTAQQPPVSRPPATRPPLPSVVTVPRLAGRTVEDARATLARISLQVGDVAEAAGTGAPGTIVRQSPRPGMPVVRGSSVQVWVVPARVAQQPPQTQTPTAPLLVRVPNLVGQPVADARETLTGASLALGETAEAAGRGAPGTVVRQQPAAGSAMLPNSRVRVWLVPAAPAPAVGGQVATRPDPPAPTRPQPQPPALPTQPAQTPVAQTRPAQDSAVQNPTASVAVVTVPVAGDSAITVPDVRRLALVDAQAALAAAGFTAVVDTALADSAGWTVSAQQPGPGARLASGGLVALLLDPPAAGPVAAATPPPPAAGPTQPVAEGAGEGRSKLWIPLAALLLIVVAAAVGAQRMRAGKRVLPVAGVSARLRMDAPARVAVEGAPFGEARLRFRMNPGRTAATVSAAGPLFVQQEVTGD